MLSGFPFQTTVAMQNFEIRVIDEFVLLGNSGIMRCSLPSFVADFIQVNSWLIIDDEESTEINVSQDNFGKQSWCYELIRNIPSQVTSTHGQVTPFIVFPNSRQAIL